MVQMKPPWAYARGILHFFGAIRRSTLLAYSADQPISQSRPLFVIAISWLFFQIHEQINWQVIGGAIFIVSGTVLLILSY